jgi:hypothetical protein
MWLLVMDEDMEIITKRQVLCGDWSHYEINLNDENKKFTPIIPKD